jgi:hypothetical protein
MSTPGREGGQLPDAEDDLPGIDFVTLVLSLSHSVLVYLGDAPNPSGASDPPDLQLARQNLDLLALLSDKTKGNLTGEEERVLEQTLYDLRMRYVEVSKAK